MGRGGLEIYRLVRKVVSHATAAPSPALISPGYQEITVDKKWPSHTTARSAYRGPAALDPSPVTRQTLASYVEWRGAMLHSRPVSQVTSTTVSYEPRTALVADDPSG